MSKPWMSSLSPRLSLRLRSSRTSIRLRRCLPHLSPRQPQRGPHYNPSMSFSKTPPSLQRKRLQRWQLPGLQRKPPLNPQRQACWSPRTKPRPSLPEGPPHLPPMQLPMLSPRPLRRLRPLSPNPLRPWNQTLLQRPGLSSRPSLRARRPPQDRQWSKSPRLQTLRPKRRRARQKRQSRLRRSPPPPSRPSTNPSSARPRRISRGRNLLRSKDHGVSSLAGHRHLRTTDSSDHLPSSRGVL